MRIQTRFRYLSLFVCTVFLAACGSIGPKTLDKDQLDYGQSIGNNWKNQMLANIVKMRFVDMPVFVDVGSIVSGYSFETQVSGRLGFQDSFTGDNTAGLSGGGRYTDRPTITYMPKTGDAYLRSLLAPFDPKSLLSLVQAGYSAELLFTWAVEAVNGVHNYSGTSKARPGPDPEFYELTELLKELQDLGVVAWEFEKQPDTGHDILLVIRDSEMPDSIQAKRRRVAEIIGLDPSINRYRVMYAPIRVSPDILALQTRSVLQTLGAMARFIDVPPEVADQAAPGFTVRDSATRPFRVLYGKDRPEQSFASIKYNDYWYWIENTDLKSKQVFTLMLFLTTLTNAPGEAAGPVLTIPTG